MDLIVLCLVIIAIFIVIIPTNEEKEEIHNDNYKLTHCDVHKWVSKTTGFDGKEFETNYTVCSECGFNPETGKYQ